MSDVAIRVENLSKRFVLGERIGIKTFRETLQDIFTAPFRRWVKNNGELSQEKVDTDKVIWALKDVSFEVKHGEVLGIIGPNGAGKSTLLKILSRITEPTAGYAEIRGRVGSLLEVGTGFHPELTGRENIYLNGAILGMSKAEIRRKFDDIVSFAGVEKFIDTPVKRYSSGMQVRLAFAVAAHLEPEILIIDEVLAVGDAEFQKRCLGKMDEVSRSGRTILFVSHNLAAIERLCNRAMFLTLGSLRMMGKPSGVIAHYLASCDRNRSMCDQNITSRYIKSVRVLDSRGREVRSVPCGADLSITMEIDATNSHPVDVITLVLETSDGIVVTRSSSKVEQPRSFLLRGRARISVRFRDLRLGPGTYLVNVLLKCSGKRLEELSHVNRFAVVPADLYGTGRMVPEKSCLYLPITEWEIWTDL